MSLSAITTYMLLSPNNKQDTCAGINVPPVAGRTPLGLTGLAAGSRGPFDASSFLSSASYPYTAHFVKTKTNPSFWIAVYKHGQEWEALAKAVIVDGVWEMEETELVDAILSDCSLTAGGGLVIDVGSFVGYYSVFSALKGCRVRVIEGHPQNALMVRLSAAVNGLTDYITIYNRVGSDGKTPMQFSGYAMDGHVAGSYATTDNALFKQHLGNWTEHDFSFSVHPLGVDAIAPSGDVLLLKVDVEGFEPHVFSSAHRLLSEKRVKYVLLEYNMWRAMKLPEGVAMILRFINYGYKVYQLPLGSCPLTRIVSEQQIMRISRELQEDTHACGRWCVYMLAVRDALPPLYADRYPAAG